MNEQILNYKKPYQSDQMNFDKFLLDAKKEEEQTKKVIPADLPSDLNELKLQLDGAGYTATNQILYALKIASSLGMPILIEGDPGVGKTSLAKAVSKIMGSELIKVQFYDGITNNDILYEYDYQKQMLYMNAIKENINMELQGLSANEALERLSSNGINFFGKEFLIERPLLKAISGGKNTLLLDEIDKASEETEYMLLELLDTFSITIPEYGTIECPPENRPMVFLTSNRYRELSDALKRRCIYLYIEPKTAEETKEIIAKQARVPEEFAYQVAKKVESIRGLNLKQKPSISDAINWAIVLMSLVGVANTDIFKNKAEVKATLGTILKNKADIESAARIL